MVGSIYNIERGRERKMELSLADKIWDLKGYWPWVPVKGNSMEIGNELLGVTDWISATVPGGVHQDLFRAGLIEDPYKDRNSLHCEWVENRWWAYRSVFEKPNMNGERIELVCKGLDYEAIVFMNGTKLGEHKGMYHPAVFDVTSVIRESDMLELMIVFKQAPDEMGQIGKTSETFTQKSRFNYKWDFSTRLVNVGIWDDVVFCVHQAYSLDDISLSTDVEDGNGIVKLSASIKPCGKGGGVNQQLTAKVTITDSDGNQVVQWEQKAATDDDIRIKLVVANARLWYPNGYGDQPLYDVRFTLSDGNRQLDERNYKTGIRKLRYANNENSPSDALPYTILVNDRKIYIKGANITPLDHLYGNVAEERYDWMVHLAKTAHINMLRIWGGGIIEKTYLYELCDRHGILIWQEFIQSSSGVDNIPSKQPVFLALLWQSAEAALKERRNHVSLVVWSGGNELMSAPDKPSTYEDENLSLLKEMVERYDPERLFLPTSASGPVQYITERKGVSHDVHGHWKYQGNSNHYRLYGQSDCLFHSEFGVDGLSAKKSLAKFISAQHLRPDNMRDNLVWRHHGEWWDTYDRDEELFGGFGELSAFVDSSQWIQAEGLRYILEANRRRKFSNSGSIIWQLNEPWPNVSCTNLVDYYMETKMAYHWVRNAYQPNHVSMDYSKLDYQAGEAFRSPVYVHRSGESTVVTVLAELLNSEGSICGEWTFTGVTEGDKVLEAGTLVFQAPDTSDDLFFIRLTLRVAGEKDNSEPNLYLFSTHEGALYETAFGLANPSLSVQSMGDWISASAKVGKGAIVRERTYCVANNGTRAALHVYPQESTDRYWMVADTAYRTIFPGESMTFKVTCIPKAEGLFEEGGRSGSLEGMPEIDFFAFGQGISVVLGKQEQHKTAITDKRKDHADVTS
jgi:beta-mannosidase